LLEEERVAVHLRHMYSQYSLLYENSALAYLASRLSSVLHALEELMMVNPF
jgi:hypothetical protein